jgi:threonine/homoserine/homoserine lactone efflux protein
MGTRRPRHRGLYARFAALTAINPLTLATFSAVASNLPAGRTPPGPAVAFVAGVALASAGWHAILAGAAGLAGRRLPATARTWTSILGAALALLLALRPVWSPESRPGQSTTTA